MNFLELKNNIRLITNLTTNAITNAELDTLINQGYHELSVAFAWPWLETTADFTVSKDTRDYALPSNFDYAIAMIDTNIDRSIPHLAAKEFFELVGQDSTSTSKAAVMWTIFDGKVYFSLPPSTAVTAAYTMYYYKNITALSGNDDIPAFHDGFHWILVEYCKWKLWGREEYFEQAKEAFAMYSYYLTEMIAWYGSPVKKAPFLWGDGRPTRVYNNLAILDI